METLLHDLRFATRMFGKRPGVCLVIVLSLALGIGANSAIFSLVNGILLRPLPQIVRPGELVGLNTRQRNTQFPIGLSYPDYLDVRDHARAFSGVAAYNQIYVSMSESGNPELVYGYIVTGNYFSLLGVKAVRGRLLGPEDDQGRGGHPQVVIGYGFWQRRFAADPQLVGKEIRLNGNPFTVIGIAPPGFIGTEVMFAPDLWVPMAMHRQIVPAAREPFDNRELRAFRAIARLQPGVSLPQARERVKALAEQLARQYTNTNDGVTFEVVPQGEARLEAGLGNIVAIASTVLLCLVGMVLLIACANVANLLLSQASARTREVSIRLAIGASRQRLIRQLLTESLLLALAGGALGLALAFSTSRLLSGLRSPTSIPFELDFSLDHRVLLFTMTVSLLAGVVFGLVPALQTSHPDLLTPLRGESGAVQTRRRSFLRSALVITQVAVSLPLLIAAALFVRSLGNASTLDLGFDPRHVITLSLDLSLDAYSEDAGRRFYRLLEDRVRGLPGVQSAAVGGPIPLDFYASAEKIAVPGQEVGKDKDYPRVLYSSVQPEYFATIGTPLIEGRTFDARDSETGARVVIINAAMAKRFWPGKDPVGRQVLFGGPTGQACDIVGVVRTGKYRILAEPPQPYLYRPLQQAYQPKMTLLVKTVGKPADIVAAVRRQVQALDPNLPVFDVRNFEDLISGRALMPFRVVATLAGAFGLLGLILATVGLYGIQSYSVAQRTHEIGLRMAMGAQRANVLALVLRQGLALTLAGLAAGLGLGFVLAKLAARLLLNVSPTDPLAFGGVVALLLGATVLASFVPARRAIALNPAFTLRNE